MQLVVIDEGVVTPESKLICVLQTAGWKEISLATGGSAQLSQTKTALLDK